MGVITLNVLSSERGVKKTMQFDPSTLVYDACRTIREKLGLDNVPQEEYGLFRVEDDPSRCVWMNSGYRLEHYLLRNQDSVEYKRKVRMLRVRMLDGAVKTIPVDESQPVSQLMVTVCTKIGIANHEEYSLVRDDLSSNGLDRSTADLRAERSRQQTSSSENKFMGTLGRSKEKKMEQLRQKLHTDEELNWVDHGKTLREQGIGDEETLLLRRKFFYSDMNVDSRDPVQLNLLYVQCLNSILRGEHRVGKETAWELGALQCQVQYGDIAPEKKFVIDGHDVLPQEYSKSKDNVKEVTERYKQLRGMAELEAKSKYVQMCRGLNTYGVSFFLVKEKIRGKKKLVPRLLGVNKECVMRVDEKTKNILTEWPLEQVRKWAPTPNTFILDFGDYADGFYTVQTTEGERISQLIGGYIDIILKKKLTRDHLGIEGDEGSTMLEDVVAPARATLVSHGQIGGAGQQVREGHVAIPGVLRTTQVSAGSGAGYGINGAQFGAVSGQILQQEFGRSQRVRTMDTRERAQRALIGTIEASIRAVEEADQEMEKAPEIELLRFPDDPNSRRWMDDQVEVSKERVNERLAAMGAATAQVVQWTAVKEEYDDRVGTAVATIGSNMPEVGRDVRDLAALMPEKRGDLIDATRRLCGAFGEFLGAVNPDQDESRTKVLAAASRVGDYSRNVITTIEEETTIQMSFTDGLMQRAKDVASSTAHLVQRAKTISAACEEPEATDKVIQSATKCAFATSQLVACTRVVAPTIDSPACQQQLTNAAKEVSRTVEHLLLDAQKACEYDSNRQQATQNLHDIHAAARQVTSALDGLLGHIRENPKIYKDTEQQRHDEYKQLLRSSNQLITHQGPSQEMVRQGEKVIRHSQILVEEFEREANQRPESRTKLLDAARQVADATSHMIDAAKECESRPGAAETTEALRTATERLQTVTTRATSEQQATRTMHELEQAAKQVAYNATQTIAAASAVKQTVQEDVVLDQLFYESTQTSQTVPRIISSIRESQNAREASEKFRAQSRLIRDSHQILEPGARLVTAARRTVPHVPDEHMASNLSTASQQLDESLSTLRVALNNAQQLNFSQQLVYSEELIKELNEELLEVQRAALANRLDATSRDVTAHSATTSLMNATRQVGSTLAQLVSASANHDSQHIGVSAVEAAQSLRQFTSFVRDVCATRHDTPIDQFIVSARSVVHDSGLVFDRVREDARPEQLATAAKQVSTSLRQVIACLPQYQHVETAINQIRQVQLSSTVREADVRKAASRLVDSTSQLVVSVRAPCHRESVDVFVHTYTDFHTAVMAALPALRDMRQRAETINMLEDAREHAIEVLRRAAMVGSASPERGAVAGRGDAAPFQTLQSTSRQLTETVNAVVERVVAEGERPWEQECDAALRQIQSVRPLLEHATLPVNDESYFSSLEQVTEQSRRLGEAMTGIARNAKAMETGGRADADKFCQSVRQSADSVCSLAESAAQSAYLVGVSHARSVRGTPALVDAPRLQRAATLVKGACERIERGSEDQQRLMEDLHEVGTHASLIASLCRDASERAASVAVKRQFINEASQLAQNTSELFASQKTFDERNSAESFARCSETAREVRETVQSLQQFVDHPDFAARPAQISPEGRDAQIPVLAATRSMLDASSNMIGTARHLATEPSNKHTWQQIANDSKDVSDSIKRLVGAIRDAAPGQAELDRTIRRIEELITVVDRRQLDAVGAPAPRQTKTAEHLTRQHIAHGAQTLLENVDGLRTAAVAKGEDLAHHVAEHWHATAPLAVAACEAAEASPDTTTAQALFEQTRTVLEAEMELMKAAREAGGNPIAHDAHSRVDESVAQFKDALHDLLSYVNRLSSEQGNTTGLVETITRSIAHTDAQAASSPDKSRSFVDAQTNMTTYLEEIARTASALPSAPRDELGARSLHLSDTYQRLAHEAAPAFQSASAATPEQAQRLKVAVQRLGSACIDCVKKAGRRMAHEVDAVAQRELTEAAAEVVEMVREVLAALHQGSKGTQACINAANTVSGIVGDLDTTILFAASGSLHEAGVHNVVATAAAAGDFSAYRDEVMKTAKSLIEDTKALVAGAASNQEQLAVAAQNAVHTMVALTETVKTGAIALSVDYNAEGQVSVMHACRDVAAALAALIHATKNASGCSLKDTNMERLKMATKTMLSNVGSLLKMVKSVEDRDHAGTLALEAAEEAIHQEIIKFEHDAGEGPSHGGGQLVTPEHLARATQRVSAAATKLASVGASLDQADAVAAANLARGAVSELLRTARSAAHETETAEARFRIINSGREVAMQVRSLMRSLHGVLRVGSPGGDAAAAGGARQKKELLLDASRALARALGDLIGCSELIKGEAWVDESDATVIAENELLGAAMAIEAAAVKLAELRPRVTPQRPDENLEFDEQILSAAKSITTAVQTLVLAASDAQRELVAQGRAFTNGTTAAASNGAAPHQDYQWSEGLISAARFVAAAVQQLCEAANTLVLGQASEERLVSAAKQVASSTAQLLIACNVRADTHSQANRRLQAAGSAVKSATERLVAAARQTIAEDQRPIVIQESIVSGIAQVMNAKEAVLRKEKELNEARQQLARLHQSRYERGGSPEE